MHYEVLHTIKTGKKDLMPGSVVGDGVLLAPEEIKDLIKAGFLKPVSVYEPDAPTEPEEEEMSLEEMNVLLSEIDPDFVCETLEEARALLAKHGS